MKTIFRPSGDQFGSSSTVAIRLIVRFRGTAPLSRRSSTFTVKMSLSSVADPGNVLIGNPAPEADPWNAMFFDVPPFGSGRRPRRRAAPGEEPQFGAVMIHQEQI